MDTDVEEVSSRRGGKDRKKIMMVGRARDGKEILGKERK
jgi:hypothetical protein